MSKLIMDGPYEETDLFEKGVHVHCKKCGNPDADVRVDFQLFPESSYLKIWRDCPECEYQEEVWPGE
jgi:hypothetical protein